MLQIQSVAGPQAEQTTASRITGSYRKVCATVAWGLPVFQPAYEQQEGGAKDPAQSVLVQLQRHPEDCERETSGLPASPSSGFDV